VGGILSIPFLLIEMPAYSAGDFGMGVIYGLVIGVIAFGCFFVAMKRLPIFQYGALTYIEVIFGVSFGIVFLGEQMSLVKAAGMVLILTSSVLSRIIDQKGSASVQAEQSVMEEN
jgi:drug/metabolite transporter (DMT)-like permease